MIFNSSFNVFCCILLKKIHSDVSRGTSSLCQVVRPLYCIGIFQDQSAVAPIQETNLQFSSFDTGVSYLIANSADSLELAIWNVLF